MQTRKKLSGKLGKQIVDATTEKIVRNYQGMWEARTLTEEEFVYDSLQNNIFVAIILNTNIYMMHLKNGFGSSWENDEYAGRGNDVEMETVSNDEQEKFS